MRESSKEIPGSDGLGTADAHALVGVHHGAVVLGIAGLLFGLVVAPMIASSSAPNSAPAGLLLLVLKEAAPPTPTSNFRASGLLQALEEAAGEEAIGAAFSFRSASVRGPFRFAPRAA